MKKLDINFDKAGIDEIEDPNIIDVTPEEKEYDSDDYDLISITPFSMNMVDNEVANLFFIAQTRSNKTYTIFTSYLLENEIEKSNLDIIPFYVDNNFTSFRVAADVIVNSFPVFVSDFNFSYIEKDDSVEITMVAKELHNNGNTNPVEFKMCPDIFCSLKYIDNYVFENVINNYELSKASISAREHANSKSSIINIDKVDRIIAMAPIKNSTTCAIEYVVADKNGKKYTILSTFDFGKKFNKKKFKGMTIDKINSVYLTESDQYLQIFSEFCRFANIDKEYLVIKGKNKDGKNDIFLMDGTSRLELESMIGEY